MPSGYASTQSTKEQSKSIYYAPSYSSTSTSTSSYSASMGSSRNTGYGHRPNISYGGATTSEPTSSDAGQSGYWK